MKYFFFFFSLFFLFLFYSMTRCPKYTSVETFFFCVCTGIKRDTSEILRRRRPMVMKLPGRRRGSPAISVSRYYFRISWHMRRIHSQRRYIAVILHIFKLFKMMTCICKLCYESRVLKKKKRKEKGDSESDKLGSNSISNRKENEWNTKVKEN